MLMILICFLSLRSNQTDKDIDYVIMGYQEKYKRTLDNVMFIVKRHNKHYFKLHDETLKVIDSFKYIYPHKPLGGYVEKDNKKITKK